jgi:uncharacterized protein
VTWSFEWEDTKNALKRVKYGVCFDEAQRPFLDPGRVIAVADAHSEADPRLFCLGIVDGRIMTVRFTVRGNKGRLSIEVAWSRRAIPLSRKVCPRARH